VCHSYLAENPSAEPTPPPLLPLTTSEIRHRLSSPLLSCCLPCNINPSLVLLAQATPVLGQFLSYQSSAQSRIVLSVVVFPMPSC
jgi:hypothetical protein